MAIPTDKTAMDIDRTSPSVQSESSTSSVNSTRTILTEFSLPTSSTKSDKSSLPFTNAFPRLPPTGHEKNAHIIDMTALARTDEQEGSIQLQDAVATALYLASPDTLRSFLSSTMHVFKAIFKREKGDKQLVIWPKGIEVFIGTFTHHTTLKAFRFEHVAGLLVGYDGSWHLKATAGNAFSSTKWAEVWSGDFECYGGVSKMVVEMEELAMEHRACVLAGDMLRERFWECKADVKVS
ncbi:hypothetical protein EJ07DRAFT_168105 [Lizonia empirigonia]|nr:hypothetical protein EJ07DRAFT_168105 [Lizonia empirigonia]